MGSIASSAIYTCTVKQDGDVKIGMHKVVVVVVVFIAEGKDV